MGVEKHSVTSSWSALHSSTKEKLSYCKRMRGCTIGRWRDSDKSNLKENPTKSFA